MCGYICICINSYCLPDNCVYSRIQYFRFCFIEMYVNVFFVKLFVQRSEFNSC